jgi:hypothetical protein
MIEYRELSKQDMEIADFRLAEEIRNYPISTNPIKEREYFGLLELLRNYFGSFGFKRSMSEIIKKRLDIETWVAANKKQQKEKEQEK